MFDIKARLGTVIIVVGLILAAGSQPMAQEDDSEKNCLECHKDYYNDLKGKWQHKPFDDKECLECHQYHAFRNKRELKAPVIEICTKCHTTIEEFDEESIHYPVLDEMSCVTCHEPHASDKNKLFLKAAVAELCAECHDFSIEDAGNSHRPYREKQCLKCHNPHGSYFPAFFQLPAGYLCIECHPDVLTGVEPSQMHSADDLNSCEQCHVGHSSDYPKLLKNRVTPLCTGCHDDLGAGEEPRIRHTVLEDENCLICHMAHAQKGSEYLTEPQPSLCFTCHSDIEERLEKNTVHAAASDESCSVCHDPHAGMLVSSTQDVCSACHDIDDKDFQTLHKVKSPPADCNSCHDPHGTDSEHLLMDNLHAPFEEGDCGSCHEDDLPSEELRSSDLCMNCHDEPGPEKPHEETALAGAVCVDCHSPHAANRDGLMRLRFGAAPMTDI